MVSRYLFVGRRREATDGRLGYVDRPSPWVIGAFVGVLVLSVADAWFTLRVIGHGGLEREANPVMREALELGPTAFVVLKTAVTFLGAAFLALHQSWRLGRVCLWFALAGYGVLTAYHLFVQSTLPPR
jgi:hypothetical protein